MKLKKLHKKVSKGSGFVLYKRTEHGLKLIVLIKPNGKFDLPKGHADGADVDAFATAQRECFEETGIFVSKNEVLKGRHFQDRSLTMFCAVTDQDPVISRNPTTGNFEHIAYVMIDPEVACKILPNYLAKAVKWSMPV